jgi:hypothetical protein
MKIEPDSVIWMYPGGAKSDLIYENRLEAFLCAYENRLVDEYIECQLHLNEKENPWWLGRLQCIESDVLYFKECGIIFDKVFEVMDHMPRYKDMSKISQENYRKICGEPVV